MPRDFFSHVGVNWENKGKNLFNVGTLVKRYFGDYAPRVGLNLKINMGVGVFLGSPRGGQPARDAWKNFSFFHKRATAGEVLPDFSVRGGGSRPAGVLPGDP